MFRGTIIHPYFGKPHESLGLLILQQTTAEEIGLSDHKAILIMWVLKVCASRLLARKIVWK